MMEPFFNFLSHLDTIFWGYIGFSLIILLGIYFSFKTKFFQIHAVPSIVKTFFHFLLKPHKNKEGIHPLKAFAASVGGMVGIGNVVGIITAVQLGGPGALFWVWIAAIFGSLIKYCEVYLGLKYRVARKSGGFDGGPMYFLAKAFKAKWVPLLISCLLCIYGVDIYLFAVVTSTVETNWDLNHYLVLFTLLGLVLVASIGGVSRVSKVCSFTMPFFIVIYIGMSLWIIGQNVAFLPEIFATIFKSAFTGHAALGGFAGSSAILAIQHGISRAAYSADIGIGYDSIIHSESCSTAPEKQARLAVLGVFLDNFICTLSILLVLVTGMWKAETAIEASRLVQEALSQYFPLMHIFMPAFLFILGYSTIIAYFCIGIKCARFLLPKLGPKIYVTYGITILIIFSFFDQTKALLVMSIAGSLLLTLNLLGIYRLRKQIIFIEQEELTSSSFSKTNLKLPSDISI